MNDFRELKVWVKAVELFESVVKDIDTFPRTETAKIISNQVLRSISSVRIKTSPGQIRYNIYAMLTDKEKQIILQALWDMDITPDEFVGIIRGDIVRKWPDRGFCAARLFESVNWFDVVKIFQPAEICEFWENARNYTRLKSVKEGMDFACRILRANTVSASE